MKFMCENKIPNIFNWAFDTFDTVVISIFIGIATSIFVSIITNTNIDENKLYYTTISIFSSYLIVSSYLIYIHVAINKQFQRILGTWKDELSYTRILDKARNFKSCWKWAFLFGVLLSIFLFIYGINLMVQINKQIKSKTQTSNIILDNKLEHIHKSITNDSLQFENFLLLQKSLQDSLKNLDNKIRKALNTFSGAKSTPVKGKL